MDAKGSERLVVRIRHGPESRLSHGGLHVGVVQGGWHFSPRWSSLEFFLGRNPHGVGDLANQKPTVIRYHNPSFYSNHLECQTILP